QRKPRGRTGGESNCMEGEELYSRDRVHRCTFRGLTSQPRLLSMIAHARAIAIVIASVSLSLPAAAQRGGGDTQGGGGGRAQWDVTLARGKTRDIDFTTSEGTWTSVDISPDASWIAFDLLGHIYRVPASGGEAVALTQNSGVALNFEPRISP